MRPQIPASRRGALRADPTGGDLRGTAVFIASRRTRASSWRPDSSGAKQIVLDHPPTKLRSPALPRRRPCAILAVRGSRPRWAARARRVDERIDRKGKTSRAHAGRSAAKLSSRSTRIAATGVPTRSRPTILASDRRPQQASAQTRLESGSTGVFGDDPQASPARSTACRATPRP